MDDWKNAQNRTIHSSVIKRWQVATISVVQIHPCALLEKYYDICAATNYKQLRYINCQLNSHSTSRHQDKFSFVLAGLDGLINLAQTTERNV